MEYDLRSHSNKRLGSILANPRHPAHAAAKAERDRRLAMKNEAATPMRNLKLINKIKNSGVVSQGSMSTDAEYHKTLGPTKNSDEGIAALKKKHGMSHDKAVSTLKRLMGEAYDEPQGQAKRMMSPLQKMRMDKEKADRDREGKLKPGVVKRGKSTMNRLKDIRQRADAFAIKSRKEEVDLDEMKDEWKTDTGWKKPETIKKDRFGNVIKNVPKHLAKAAAKKSAEMNKEEVELDEAEMSLYDKIKAARANPSPDKPVRGRGSKNRNPKTYDVRNTLDKEDDRLQGMVKKKLKKEEVEKVDEVLDRPGALDSYRKKADASGNKARNSATRKILTAPKDGERPDHSAELKTMKKRNKGQDMADRVAARQFRKSIGQPYIKKESVEEIDEISKDMTNRYMKKAFRQYKRAQDKQHVGPFGSATQKGADANKERLRKRHKGIGSVHKRYGGNDLTDRDPARNSMTGKKAPYQHESVELIDEKKLTPKEVKRALASIKPPKKKPTLPKAPWEKEKTEEGFVSHAQRKAVWATKKDGGKGHPDNKKKNEAYVPEGLTVGDGMGSWIKDFQASDAPQFAGKSQKKKRDMAIAAYLDAKRSKKESVEEASVINGKKQDPNSTRWKSTSLSHADAVAKHGKDNVRKGMFKRGDGSHDVQVKSKLGEENIDEKKGLTIPKFRSALYKGAKALGDVQAVKKKKVGKRVGRRVVGKMAGRLLGKMFR